MERLSPFASGKLRLRLALDALERSRLHALERRVHWKCEPGEGREGRHPAFLQALPLVPGCSGDQREMVVRLPPVTAVVVPVAVRAKTHGLRVGVPRIRAVLLEPLPQGAFESGEICGPERFRFAGAAEREMHRHRRRSLCLLEEAQGTASAFATIASLASTTS